MPQQLQQRKAPSPLKKYVLLLIIVIMCITTIAVQVRSFEIAGTPFDINSSLAPSYLKTYNRVYALGINVLLLIYSYILFAVYILYEPITVIPGVEWIVIFLNFSIGFIIMVMSGDILLKMSKSEHKELDVKYKERVKVMKIITGIFTTITLLSLIWGYIKYKTS